MNRFCPFLVSVVIGLVPQSASAANLIVNGGFEQSTPVAPVNGFSTVSGGTALAPWVVQPGSVDVVNTGFWPAFEGQQSIDLNGSSPGTITQTFATISGTSYTLAFEYANNFLASPAATATVSVLDSGGGTLLSQNITHSGSTRANMNYTPFSGSFVADTTDTTLRFVGTGPAFFGIALDAVSVSPSSSAIPEPASAVLAIIGGLMVLGYGWSQRKTKLAA